MEFTVVDRQRGHLQFPCVLQIPSCRQPRSVLQFHWQPSLAHDRRAQGGFGGTCPSPGGSPHPNSTQTFVIPVESHTPWAVVAPAPPPLQLGTEVEEENKIHINQTRRKGTANGKQEQHNDIQLQQ